MTVRRIRSREDRTAPALNRWSPPGPVGVKPEQKVILDDSDGTAPRQAQDLAGKVLAGFASAVPPLALGAVVPRFPGDRSWRLPAVVGLTLLPAGWALGSDAPLVALTLVAAFVAACGSARAFGRRP